MRTPAYPRGEDAGWTGEQRRHWQTRWADRASWLGRRRSVHEAPGTPPVPALLVGVIAGALFRHGLRLTALAIVARAAHHDHHNNNHSSSAF